jgi:RNA polymerase sigma-32 factor
MAKELVTTKQLAVRDGLDVYLQGIRNIPVLSREEESRLAKLWYEKRDRDAGQKLVLSNLRFVVKIAREYAKYGFRLGDLIQEGNLGLMHAVDRFDPRKGFRLISYAVWWIRAYIQAYVLRSWSMVRMGTTRIQRRIMSGLYKARRKIAALGASEAPEQRLVAGALDVSEQDLKETVSRMQMRDVSLEAPLAHRENATFGDSLRDETPDAETQLVERDLRKRVRETLDGVYEDLNPRERYLLDHRLLSDAPITLEAAGKSFGVTRERVRQIEARLKSKLRVQLTEMMAA